MPGSETATAVDATASESDVQEDSTVHPYDADLEAEEESEATPETEQQEETEDQAEDQTEEGSEEETEGEEEGAEEETEAEEGDEDKGSIKEGEITGLTDEGRRDINARFAKMRAKQGEAERRAESAEAQAGELKAQLESRLAQEAYQLGLDPSYVNEDEVAILKKDSALAESEVWLLEHFDGYEGKGTEEDPNMTAADVRKRYGQVVAERRGIADRAKRIFDEKIKSMTDDMNAGRSMRLKKERVKTPTAGAKKIVKKKPAKVPPGVSGAGGKTPIAAKPGRKSFDSKKVIEDGATPEGIQAAYEDVF